METTEHSHFAGRDTDLMHSANADKATGIRSGSVAKRAASSMSGMPR